jgi:SAM-dependent methyltransferase
MTEDSAGPQRRDDIHRRIQRIRKPAFLGTLRRRRPISERWGSDRGTPVDRYYIERFLAAHRADIRGRVLEVKDGAYTKRFGSAVAMSDVLDVDPRNTQATVIADLATADSIPTGHYDCVILTQVLQYIFDTRAAIAHVHRLLKPAGVLLMTLPSVSRILPESDYWRFTPAAGQALVSGPFDPRNARVQAQGNMLSMIAFVAGMAWEELSQADLDHEDDEHALIVTVRAVKS